MYYCQYTYYILNYKSIYMTYEFVNLKFNNNNNK